MKVLDLFSGLGGWGKPFEARGHDVVGVDVEPRFQATLTRDVRGLRPREVVRTLGGWPDVVLASPPCEKFSLVNLGRHFGPGGVAVTQEARDAVGLVQATLDLIDALGPAYWVLENPRGFLRVARGQEGLLMRGFARRSITYCVYGFKVMKPTDLWGYFPPSWTPREPCQAGQGCHEAAPRGSHGGLLKVKGPTLRASVPRTLALDLCQALERDLGARGRPSRSIRGRRKASG